MFKTVDTEVFPYLRALGTQLGGDGSAYAEQLKGIRFTIPNANLLARVVDMLDKIDVDDRDTKGDLYEYLPSKIARSGVNGQFRTPRHIIQLMVEMIAPRPSNEICDPACGTAGFLVAASEYVREKHPSVLSDAAQRQHFNNSMFPDTQVDDIVGILRAVKSHASPTEVA